MSSIQDRINALKKSQGENAPDKDRRLLLRRLKLGREQRKCSCATCLRWRSSEGVSQVVLSSSKNGCEKVLSLTDYVDRKG